jgi:hypothetical protein|tara:strand:- start:2748 stop:3362 length:615 start_codon:yes stop_codon:yes gene_type:complete
MSEAGETFDKCGYACAAKFISAELTQTLSRYMEYCVNQNSYIDNLNTEGNEKTDPTSRFSRYADPLIETILADKLPEIEEIVGKELYPTYSYARVYMGEDVLAAHVDRPSCEYSVTVNIATIGHPWPIYVKKEESPQAQILLEPGNAVIYKGCEMLHWRDPMSVSGSKINVQFMLHYVDKSGPYAEHKWDKRPSLGLSAATRGG